MGKKRYLEPKHNCSHCKKPFKRGKLIIVDGASDLVFCYSADTVDCLQKFLLSNPIKNRSIFGIIMAYRGGFEENDPTAGAAPSRKTIFMEKISSFLGGQIAR